LIEQSPLQHADLYHTGIVVDDLTAAKQKYGHLFGLTWLEGGAEIRIITDQGVRIVTSAYAISAEGPHHVELVQSVPGTLYTVARTHHAHHLGYWVDDVRAASAALSTQGLPSAAVISFGKDDAAPVCAYHEAGDGFYVEIVSRALRPWLFRSNS
jgi:hypothetical protein